MNEQDIINQTAEFVRQSLSDAEGGHDWWHIYRVWNLSKHIAQAENVDMLIVELGALLHDIADAKFHNGDEEIGPQTAQKFLQTLAVNQNIIDHVCNIVRYISFKGGKDKQIFFSPELAVVQDADRLDALGAMGIARTFNFGGHIGNPIYDPTIGPNLDMTREEYKKNKGTSINHFYEKLLLLKDRMNTKTGKNIALDRHRFMEQFLEEFYHEWDGVK